MKKKILLLLSVLLLWGCQSTPIPTKTLKQKTTLSFFYVETCSQCKAFKKEAIPYLEKMYGDSLVIQLYDLDDEKTEPIYDKVIDSLQDFDQEFYKKGPFYAVEGYFATVGYTSGDQRVRVCDPYNLKDIEKAVNHEELGYELEAYRFLYKES